MWNKNFTIVSIFVILAIQFYETNAWTLRNDNNRNLVLYVERTRSEAGCQTIQGGTGNIATLQTDADCLHLYTSKDCSGTVMKTLHSRSMIRHELTESAFSFDLCNITDPTPAVTPRYSLYESSYHYSSSLLLHYTNVSECTNLPSFADNKLRSINTHDYCLRIYEHKDCKGQMLEVKPCGEDQDHHYLSNFRDMTSSIGPCADETGGCPVLRGEISKIIFKSVNNEETLGTLSKLEMTPSSFCRNNGSRYTTKMYEARKQYAENYRLEKFENYDRLQFVSVGSDVAIEGGDDIPLISEGMKQQMSYWRHWGYDYYRHRRVFGERIGTHREFAVKHFVRVPPCSVQEVKAYLEVRENVSLEYEMELQIKGWGLGKNMVAAQLQKELPAGLKYVKDLDYNKILVTTKGKITGKYGVKTEVEVNEMPIEGGCVHNKVNPSTTTSSSPTTTAPTTMSMAPSTTVPSQ